MAANDKAHGGFRLPFMQGVLPIYAAQIPTDLIAGLTLAALAIPEVMGYTKIAGMPVITGLYTILIPMALFALFGSSRHLVVGADSATAAILAAGLVGLASVASDQYVALAAVLAFMAAGFLILAQIIGLAFLADFLSRTVLVGFLTGVGIQVAFGEISGMLGLKGGGHGTLGKVWNDLQQIEQVNFYALAIALGVLLVLLFLTGPLAYMPEAVLSAVVFLVGIDLIDLDGMKRIYQQRRSEFWVALITTAMVVIVGVEQGIILAIVLSLIDHTRRGYHPKNVVLEPADSSGVLRAKPVASAAQAEPGLLIYRFTHSMYYANAQQLTDEITTLVNNADPALKWLCFDASAIDDVDFSAAESLRAIFTLLKDKGVRLVVAQVLDDVRKQSRYHLDELFGKDAYYDTLDNVVKAYRKNTTGQG